MITPEQAWTVYIECSSCGEEVEMSELRYVELGNICEECVELEDIET